MRTIREATFDLLRKLGITTIVGNPGSTEESFLQEFPSDFTYVLALQEASVVGIADGLSQGMRRPVIVNVHTGPGIGNAMGCILTAYQNKTPLILTSGQQAREMLLLEPLLTNVDAEVLPRPWVKWSHQPARAEDVPAAFMRAYAAAMQPPAGPVYLSLPLDDWGRPAPEEAVVRSVSTRVGPDPDRVASFARTIAGSRSPVLVYGSDIARSQAWDAGIALAEKLGAPVWAAPMSERTPFPETHALYAGALPAAIGPLSEKLAGHDLVVVVGAPVFRYYPLVRGPYLPEGSRLLHVTDDPLLSSRAPVGDSLISDSLLFLEAVTPLVTRRDAPRLAPRPAPASPRASPSVPIAADDLFALIRPLCPEEFVLVEESPSNTSELARRFPVSRPDSFFTFASGGLGWNMPAAVGLALAEKQSGRNRPVVAVIGDGSFQYSLQSIYTAVQQDLHVVFVVPRNEEYGILKQFAVLEKAPGVPGLDLPGLDIASLGRGYGARAARVETPDEITAAFREAIARRGTTVLEVPIQKRLHALLE